MRRAVRPYIIWSTVYTLLAVVLTFPLILHLRSTIAHDAGDPLMSVALLWWNAHVVPLTERWWTGFAFFPTPGMVAFSDHRLGESLIAAPLQWAGCSPATAYNVTFLATFPLCAIAAHALGFALTRRHDAAAICGLAYGFNPYRMAHLAHLELLAAFGLPFALLSLHQLVSTRRPQWAIGLAASLVLQALCTSYYIAFFAILLAWWLFWYLRPRDWRVLALIGGAVACLVIALLPVAVGYSRIHRQYGMAHNIGEVTSFSADVTSLASADGELLLWGWAQPWRGDEGQLFPGAVATAIVVLGVVEALRRRTVKRDRGDRVSLALAALGAVYAVVTAAALIGGPWRLALGPLTISADVFYKPLSVVAFASVLAVATWSRSRDAWRRASTFGFYVTATVILYVFSFGPRPTFLGRQVLYQPPYAWLMHLPIFSDEIRAPARFAMLAILTLSAAAAVAFDRLELGARRRIVAGALMLGIVADGWIRHFPVAPLPEAVAAEDKAADFDAVLEMPLGSVDPAAMYRATLHRRPLINGTSGYLPPHYEAMAAAIRDKDDAVLDAVGSVGRVFVSLDTRLDADRFWRGALMRHGAVEVGAENTMMFFAVPKQSARESCAGTDSRIASFSAAGGVDRGMLLDGDPKTVWYRSSQRAGDELRFDLAEPTRVCAIRLSLGRGAYAFPRRMTVAISADGANWATAFEGSASAMAVRAAIANPTNAWLIFPIDSADAIRFVRLRLEVSEPLVPWQIAEIRVNAVQ
jgi:hypothetical protein